MITFVVSHLLAMDRMVLPLVILFFHCVHGHPQTREIFYRRTTTPDPIQAFFSSCNPHTADCVREQNCASENILNVGRCSGIGQVCCKRENTAVVFPDYTTPRPVRTTATTTTARPRTTKPTTLKPTTTEEPFTGWLYEDCGVRQSTQLYNEDIRDSERDEFPWNVAIFSESVNSFGYMQNVFYCGGTLIDASVVITSANCESLKPNTKLSIAVGVWNLSNPDENWQIRKVVNIIKHPGFKLDSRISSIALLVLDDQVDFTPRINRICLPEPDIDLSQSMCFVTGWGGSEPAVRSRMKLVEMQRIKHGQCEAAVRKIVRGHYQLNPSFLCAREDLNNHICSFDVGSPLFCSIPGRENQFYQVGIFVWNQFVQQNPVCGDNVGTVNLFVDIQQFKKWIDDKMEENDRSSNIYTPQPLDDNDDNN
ncbi:inactive CLIP domain-containing serine protease A30 [Aedes albopictus]|uniref:Peptidase S1 domain-containing protein n=1 Tax=Aedes albopictus TaxID=7160 RepID=A0ABM1XK64_AEDAL|nr:phenoloxidase-activating factor 2-like [Aedes albopictus]